MAVRVQIYFQAIVVSCFFRILSSLWRVTRIRVPRVVSQGFPCVYAHWHGDELLLLGAYKDTGMAVMSSRSRDGELMASVLMRLGYSVVRGSSSRGGAGGLKGLIDKVAKEKRSASLAVDGPRGPIYTVKPGIVKLASQTGVWLIPGAAAAGFRFVFKRAWNRCYLPLPLARGVIVYGEARQVPLGLSEEELTSYCKNLERDLMELKDEAEGFFGRKVSTPTCPSPA